MKEECSTDVYEAFDEIGGPLPRAEMTERVARLMQMVEGLIGQLSRPKR